MDQRVALRDGTSVGGYRVVEVLGSGGFGITYRALDPAKGDEVALKEFFPLGHARRIRGGLSLECLDPANSTLYQDGLRRITKEAEMLMRFRHPHIVQVRRLLRENNTVYLILSFERGTSLRNWVRDRRQAPSQHQFDRLLPPLLDALAVVHKNGLLHRDIAPDNIYVRANEEPVLLDFGSSRPFEGDAVKGVTHFIKQGFSPWEQYLQDVRMQGAWTDIYALGATLYDCLSGAPPPDAQVRSIELRATGRDSYRSIHLEAPGGFRPAFLDAIDHALALDPQNRPRSIRRWQEMLFSEQRHGAPAAATAAGVATVRMPNAASMLGQGMASTRSTTKRFFSRFTDWFR
jgi:serine/threonine protein kinase